MKKLNTLSHKNILYVEPVGYQEMLYLTKNARAIITDSGGLQKEAYFLHVPCITVRDETEWKETLEGAWNILAKPDKLAEIAEKSPNLKRNNKKSFGDGSAAEKIAAIMHKTIPGGLKHFAKT